MMLTYGTFATHYLFDSGSNVGRPLAYFQELLFSILTVIFDGIGNTAPEAGKKIKKYDH
jgi:hypothetical protein